jgi:hypothetical protein
LMENADSPPRTSSLPCPLRPVNAFDFSVVTD